MASVTGRGFPAPTLLVEHHAGGVILRIDDELNPEAWLQLFLTWEELSKWQEQHTRARELTDLLTLAIDTPLEHIIPEVQQQPAADVPNVAQAAADSPSSKTSESAPGDQKAKK